MKMMVSVMGVVVIAVLFRGPWWWQWSGDIQAGCIDTATPVAKILKYFELVGKYTVSARCPRVLCYCHCCQGSGEPQADMVGACAAAPGREG